MFLEKWRQKQRYEEQAFKAIEKLKEQDSSYLSQVYSIFASGHKILIKQGGMAISRLLKSYSMAHMIRLNQLFRQYTSMEWYVDWQRVDLKKIKNHFAAEMDYIYALMLGTFHPNGYFRERCMCDIAEFENTLPYLILRMNDWVGAIRLQACTLVKKKLEDCRVAEIFLAAQALEAVKASGRRENNDLQTVEMIIRETLLPFLEINEADGIYLTAGDGMYESGLILCDIWDLYPVENDYVIGIPERSYLIIADSKDEKAIENMESVGKKLYNEASYPITDKLIYWTGSEFSYLTR